MLIIENNREFQLTSANASFFRMINYIINLIGCQELIYMIEFLAYNYIL